MYKFKPDSYPGNYTSYSNETICRTKKAISDSAYRAHMVLLSTSRSFQPNEKWLAKTLGKSVSSIQRDVKELKMLGLLRILQKWEDQNGVYRTKWLISEEPNERWLAEMAERPQKPP